MKLLKFLKPYWKIAIMAPICMMAEVIADLFQPKLMAKIVDEGVLNGDLNIIITTGLTMLLIAVLGSIAGMSASAFAGVASQSYSNDLRNETFRKVMSLSLEQTDEFTTGSLVTRLTNDIVATKNLVDVSLRMFVRTSFMFVGGIIMALTLDIHFGAVLICALPVELIILWLVLSKSSPMYSIVQKKLDKLNSVVQENILGARVVKSFVREEYEEERFKKANNELMETSLRVQKLMAILRPFLMLTMNIAVLAIIFIGGLQINAKAMQIGQVMACITYVTQILMSILMIGTMFQTIIRAKVSAARIQEVLDTKPVIVGGNKDMKDFKGDITFNEVTFHYPSFVGKPVLKKVNLKIKAGENVAILGATGSGKTSLVNLIPRFYDVTSGEIKIDGVNIKEFTLESLRRNIGYVLQKSELFSGTIMDNIRWGNEKATDEEVIAAAKIAQAHEFIVKFKDKYKCVIGEKGASLSGGQKQRLAIARAILKKPKILILDDSTSALDLGTEAKLQKALKENLKNTTVIKIAQRVASVMNADKIAVLDNGTICACGTHEELLKTSSLYRNILESQMKGDENI